MSKKTINITIDDLIERFKKYNDNEEDIDLIRKDEKQFKIIRIFVIIYV